MKSSSVALSESEYFALAESESLIPTNEFSNLNTNTVRVTLSCIVAESLRLYMILVNILSSIVIESNVLYLTCVDIESLIVAESSIDFPYVTNMISSIVAESSIK